MSAEGFTIEKYIKYYNRMGNHSKRFDFINKLVIEKNVLDWGCGYGIGALLMKKYRNYVGIDIDQRAIDYATKTIRSRSANTEFKIGSNLDQLQRYYRWSDLTVCFEVIEHLNDPIELLDSLVSVTKSRGLIVLSTPNGLSSKGDSRLFRSRHHMNEYSPRELEALLESYGIVELYEEYRFDRLDVIRLRRRMTSTRNLKNIEETVTGDEEIPIGEGFLFSTINNYFNGPLFWEIKKMNDTKVKSEKLRSSTLVATLRIA